MLKKIPFPDIAGLLNRYQPTPEALAVLAPQMSPSEAITALKEANLYVDLVTFIAHALPVMEAIHWAYLSLQIRQGDWTNDECAAIDAARQWLLTPTETQRIRAEQVAQRLELDCAPAWIAKSVFWSGNGSIVAPDLPAVMPPANLYGHGVNAAITIAAAVPQWDNYDAFYKKVVALGCDIANGIATGEL